MNIKRFIAAVVAGYIFAFLYEMMFHGHLLMSKYEETAHLWRPHETMHDFIPIMTVMSIAFIIVLAFVFTRNYEGKGLGEGLRFGAYTGVLFGLWQATAYCYMPISASLAVAWFAGVFLELVGIGVIFALVYRR